MEAEKPKVFLVLDRGPDVIQINDVLREAILEAGESVTLALNLSRNSFTEAIRIEIFNQHMNNKNKSGLLVLPDRTQRLAR